MQLKNKSDIINKMFNNELEILKQKYLNISNKDVDNIMNKIVLQSDKDYILENIDLLMPLVEKAKVVDENIICLYIFLNRKLTRIYDISKSIDIWAKIEDCGFIRFDDYIIYKDYPSLEKFIRGVIYMQLGIDFHSFNNIIYIVSKQNREDYMFKKRSKEEIANEIILSNDIVTLLGITPEIVFKGVGGNEFYYSYINI